MLVLPVGRSLRPAALSSQARLAAGRLARTVLPSTSGQQGSPCGRRPLRRDNRHDGSTSLRLSSCTIRPPPPADVVPRLATTGRQIPTLGVTTPRTSLEVLSLEMPFTQSPVLESRDFVKEASRRGVRLDESLLEDLHRKKMLIPFYWAHPGLSRKLDVTDVSRSRMAQLGNSGVTPRLIPPASNGEVTDPEHWPFRRWSRSTPRQVRPDMHSGIYYSRHQLLLLPLIRRYVEEHQTFFVGRPPKDLRSFTRLNPDFMPDAGYEAACSEWRSVAVILSALDTVILPELSRKVSWPDQWRAMRDAFDADQALEWLGLSRRRPASSPRDCCGTPTASMSPATFTTSFAGRTRPRGSRSAASCSSLSTTGSPRRLFPAWSTWPRASRSKTMTRPPRSARSG